jgi:serine/threonine protein kinase
MLLYKQSKSTTLKYSNDFIPSFRLSFYNEISLLTSLCHPNITHAYGLCSEPTLSLLTESPDLSTIDLYQYLQYYKQDQPTENTLYALTLFFARQISSALAYLESLNIYHRDIATRSCLVSFDLNIKLHDLAICNEIYADDYALITIEKDIQTRRPIRWCAWETICLVRKEIMLDF